MLIFRHLFILVFLCFSFRAESQEFSYKFYGVPDGLAQSQVTKLYHDRQGFLWVVTKGGVSRFDGIRFLNFKRADGLFVYPVIGITETDNGDVWFMDENGLTCWNGSKMSRINRAMLKGSYELFVFYCSENDEPTVCLVRQPSDISVISLQSGKLTEKTFSFPGLRLVFTQAQNSGILYDSVNDRILFYSEKQGLFCFKNGEVDTLKGDNRNITSVFRGEDGNCYSWKGAVLNKISGDLQEPIFNSGSPYNGRDSRTVIEPGGTLIFEKLFGKITVWDHGNSFQDSFRFTAISCLFIDRGNNLWIGTESGLYRLMSRAFVNFMPEKCKIFPAVWSVTEDNNGDILFSSYTDGLQRYDHKSFHTIHGYEELNTYKDAAFYMGSIKSAEGKILLTRNDVGAVMYDGTRFGNVFEPGHGTACFQLFEDPDNGDLLAGTNRGLIIRSKKGIETRLKIYPGGQNQPNIVSILKDRSGRYWLGGFHGISLYDKGKEITLPTPSMPFSKGGNALLKDPRGNIWIGNDEGLFLYDYSEFRKAEHPSLNVFVTALALVGDTGLLVGSVNGLGWLDLKKFYDGETVVHHFDKENGFQGIEVGQNGIVRDSKGYYWIPASDRVVRFDPRQFRRKSSSPRTSISSLSILSENMNWELLAENAPWDSTIFLKHYQKNLRFSFIGINMSDPGRVLYQFMLDGYDKGWSNPDKAGSAVYTNLSPGDYTFRVKACNEFGIWNEEPASLRFRIVPAIYQSWWFWGICFIVIGAVFIYLGFLINANKKRKMQEKLEQEKKLAELQLISLKNQIDPHFTFNAMNAIASVVLKEDKELAYRFFMKLSALIRAILVSGDKVTRTLGEELQFVSNYLEVEKFRFRERMDYTLDFDPGLDLDQEVPKTVVQTYVENAIKHGLMHKDGGGHLLVKVINEDAGIKIVVEDNGIGRAKAAEMRSTSTGKGYYILNGYYEYFRNFRKTEIRHTITDLYEYDREPAGTRVEVFIPKQK